MGFKNFIKEEDGIGTVEVVLLLVIIVIIIVAFRDKITAIVKNALKKIDTNGNGVVTQTEGKLK